MGFSADLQKNIEAAKLDINNKCYAIVDEVLIAVVDNTRVLTGLLKNSWFPTDGPEPSSEVGTEPDGTGSNSVMRIDSLKQSEAFNGKDGIVMMANNLDYAVLRGQFEMESVVAGYQGK